MTDLLMGEALRMPLVAADPTDGFLNPHRLAHPHEKRARGFTTSVGDTLMSDIALTNAFRIVEGRPVTNSFVVAQYFEKQHKNVIRDIGELLTKKPELRGLNFELTQEIKQIGAASRSVPVYLMDRKGFSLLAMGFTGAKALEFKCAFYDQFERMEEALRAPTDQSSLITTTEQYEIRKAIKSRAKNSSVHYQTVYNALYDYFKIASYKDLRHDQMKAALALIETCSLKQHDELSFFELAQEHNALQTTAAAEYSFSVAYSALEAARAMLALTLYDSPFSADSQTCRLLDQVMFCNAALKNRVTALANRVRP